MGMTGVVTAIFSCGGVEYGLMHHNDDDSRTVQDASGKVFIRFDYRLGVHRNGKRIGRIASGGVGCPMWQYIPDNGGEKFTTSFLVNGYHWLNIEQAEIEVAKFILEGGEA